MCPPTVINTCTCGETKAGVGSFLAELLRAAAWWTLRKTTVLLFALAVITAKAAGRGLRALYRAGRRHWQARAALAVVVDEQPMPLAITAAPDGHVLWSQINKESVR